MQEKTFEVTYTLIDDDDETYTVSVDLSKGAERVLFNGLAEVVYDDVKSGTFNGETVHLYKRLADQKESYPPWMDTTHDERTYDLELTMSEYRTISSVVGSQLENIIHPSGADPYRDLMYAWEDMTEQIEAQHGEEDDINDAIEQMAESIVDDNE